MTDSEHDDEFEAYLKRRVTLNKGVTPPDRLEPPAELDRIVIGNARKAIQDVPPVRHYRAPKWALPVALAATLIISVVVVLDLSMRAKRHSETAYVAQEPATTQVVESAPVADIVAPAPAAVGNSTIEDKSRASKAARRSAAAKPASPPPPKMVERIKVPPIPTVPWPPAATPSNTAAAGAVASQAPDEKARTRLARAEVAASRSRTDTGSAEDLPTEAAARSAPVSAVASAESASGDHPEPATWLGQIEKLRNAGRTAEAEQEIKHFREVYPSYPVPAEAPSADGRAQ